MVNPLELDGSEYTSEFINDFLVENPDFFDRVLAGDAPDLRQPLQHEDPSPHQFQYNSTSTTPLIPDATPQSTTPKDAATAPPLLSGTDGGPTITAPSTFDSTSTNTTTSGSETTPNTSNQSLRLMLSSAPTKAKKTPAPNQPRAKCTQCGNSFQLPKKPSSQTCSKCKRKATEDVNVLAEIQEVTATIPLPGDLAAATSSKTWDSLLEDPETARNQLLQKPVLKIKISMDDYASLDRNTIMDFSKQMFDALLAPPVQPPNAWDDEKKEKYRVSQLKAFARCNDIMLTHEDQSDASARCRLVVDDAIKLHEDGLPIIELTREARTFLLEKGPTNGKGDPKRFKTRTSLLLDVDITCSERITKIVEAVRKNKIVAEDLLDGFKTLDLIRCPTAFLDRKTTNFTCNRGKHADEKAGGDMRREKERQKKEAAAATLVDLSQTADGRKRKASVMEELGGAPDGENMKRTRTAGDASVQASLQPHDGYGELSLEGFDDATAFLAPEMRFYDPMQQLNDYQQPTIATHSEWPTALSPPISANFYATDTNPYQLFPNNATGATPSNDGGADYYQNVTNNNLARHPPLSNVSTASPAQVQRPSRLSGIRKGK